MSANQRLERLLYVLPLAARKGGVHIEELARALDVTPAVILADIGEAMTRDFYQPAGSVDNISLSLDDNVVRLYGTEFNRPVRLSAPEAMALGLGLRVLAAEAEPERRAEILEFAHRLESELVTPELELQPLSHAVVADASVPEYQMAFGDDDFRGMASDAIRERLYCEIVYLKAGASEPAQRRIAPMRLLYTNGHWYMSAIDAQSDQSRVYRMDRILDLVLTADTHSYDDAGADASAFTTNGAREVTVRYSKTVAKWIAERENAQCEADGTLVLTHEVADMQWLIRHVLQYGGEAVVETENARRPVADAALSIA
jgi:predicted DNA-binding transcriptional regulator YafY